MSGNGASVRVCHFDLGVSIAYGAECPTCRARVPPLARVMRRMSQWTIASSPKTPATRLSPSW
eukprot:15446106-Alexandrium_andersonii.AAC.1